MTKYSIRIFLMAALLNATPSFAAASNDASGIEVIKAHATCDGSIFPKLLTDARRWSQEASFKRRSGLAYFQVKNRHPAGARQNDEAMLNFRSARNIAGLKLTTYFDSDLSKWSHFHTRGLNFITWGFYVKQTPEDVMKWLSKNADGIHNALSQPRPGTPDGMYCTVEIFEQGKWQSSMEACDQGLPVDTTPRRVFAVRPKSDDTDASILSCELWGVIPQELLKESRPDLK